VLISVFRALSFDSYCEQALSVKQFPDARLEGRKSTMVIIAQIDNFCTKPFFRSVFLMPMGFRKNLPFHGRKLTGMIISTRESDLACFLSELNIFGRIDFQRRAPVGIRKDDVSTLLRDK